MPAAAARRLRCDDDVWPVRTCQGARAPGRQGERARDERSDQRQPCRWCATHPSTSHRADRSRRSSDSRPSSGSSSSSSSSKCRRCFQQQTRAWSSRLEIARLLTQQETPREAQRARRVELERVGLERDRLARQQAQLQQTERWSSRDGACFLDNTPRAEFTDGCVMAPLPAPTRARSAAVGQATRLHPVAVAAAASPLRFDVGIR